MSIRTLHHMITENKDNIYLYINRKHGSAKTFDVHDPVTCFYFCVSTSQLLRYCSVMLLHINWHEVVHFQSTIAMQFSPELG